MNEETNPTPIREALGPYHSFWLLREDECDYADYIPFAKRKDAPIRIADDMLGYVADTLAWVPTRNPNQREAPSWQGLDWHGPTIIEQSGGAIFAQICGGWANLLRCSPERLTLPAHGSFIMEPISDEAEWTSYRFWTDRDAIVADLERLAEFGRQAATGEFYILHLGI